MAPQAPQYVADRCFRQRSLGRSSSPGPASFQNRCRILPLVLAVSMVLPITSCEQLVELPPESDRKLVFLNSIAYAGNQIGGLEGADEKCQSSARAASLTGTYKAWLSDSASPSNQPQDRFEHARVPYVLTDTNSTRIADDWSDLVDGDLIAPINFDESGNRVSPGQGMPWVWTNTRSNGTLRQVNDCNDWTTTNGFAIVGDWTRTDAGWTNTEDGAQCSNPRRFYCFQQ